MKAQNKKEIKENNLSLKVFKIFGIVLSIILILLCALFLFAISPRLGRGKDLLKKFEDVKIAHRGFHDNTASILGEIIPENSLKAFKLAEENNFAIELDVQITKDKKLVIYHNYDTEELCGIKKIIAENNYDEIKNLRLLGTEQKIPLLTEVFKEIKTTTPILVEIKVEQDKYLLNTVEVLNEILKKEQEKNRIFCIMSFNPKALKWFKKNNPEIIRGQLFTSYDDYRKPKKGEPVAKSAAYMLSNLLTNFISRPDFVSYNFKEEEAFGYKVYKFLYRNNIRGAWTIKNNEDFNKAKEKAYKIFIGDNNFFK